MALTQDRNTPHRDGAIIRHAVKGGVTIYAGALVVLDGGFAKPGVTGVGLVAVGRAERQVDNAAGANGDAFIDVRRGVFAYDNAAADPLDAADVGKTCFIVDDATVAATDGGDPATRSAAGRVLVVEDDVVWVEVG
ncbi:MAG: hypothetical protein KDJ37_08830 [Hyphomicrobiaceae bacterium]|nr:hypothetical protein [Hyphomicrobiaceae bacterium]